MRFIIDHDYHIHSRLSTCSKDPEQTAERILRYAKENRLRRVCVTDHFWDEKVGGASAWYEPQNFAHISSIRPLPKAEGVEFLFGCETDMDMNFRLGISPERFDEFDFIIIPTTHLQMVGFTISESDAQSNERRAALWVERMDRLLEQKLPFEKIGIAHSVCPLIRPKSREEYLEVLDLIPEDDAKRVYKRAAALGCGIEINYGDMCFKDEEAQRVLRLFYIAKDCGCKFYLGSDAHHPGTFDNVGRVFSRAIEMLALKERDKFRIGEKR